MRDMKRGLKVCIFEKAPEFRLVDGIEGLIACHHPLSEKLFKLFLIPISLLFLTIFN
jgi:hypothetical protein